MPDYDLTTSFVLWLFGSFAAGGLLGAAIGRFTRFEVGLAVGLLVPGLVSLSFTLAFATAYLHFRDAPDRTMGRVVAVEMRPVSAGGGVTTPVAIVEYEGRAGETLRVESGAASGLAEGETAVVLREPTGPRVGSPRQLFGGAIASLLFGTFPASAAVFFLASAARDASERRKRARPVAEKPATHLTTAANLALFFGLVVPGFLDLDVARQITIAFGVVSIGLWMHVIEGIARGRDLRWWLGIGVLAVNFGVWSAALFWLAPEAASW